MSPVQRWRGAEIQVAVAVRVQDRLKALAGRRAYWTGRQAGILVGVVWRVYLQMPQEDAVRLVVETEGHRRIGLKEHPDTQPVEIDSGD